MGQNSKAYDIAVSFAGAQRGSVESVVRECKALGLNVFYDRDATVEFWGRNFIIAMREIYGGTRAKYFVPFLSEEYLTSGFPMDEFNAAMARAVEAGADSYILPILVGPVVVPKELLNPAVGYLRLEDYQPGKLAQIIAARVGVAQERHQEPKEIADLAGEAFTARLPRLPQVDSIQYETLETVISRTGSLFEREAGKLTAFGLQCIVTVSAKAVDVRVDRLGQPVCGLRLYTSDVASADRLLMAFEWPRISGDSFNGWATAQWDGQTGRVSLQFTDFQKIGNRPASVTVTAEELFVLLWEKIIDFLESAH